jgi:hypothetical protein
LGILSSYAFAAEEPNKEDAMNLVKEAVAYAKENSKDKFLNDVRNPSGKLHFKEGSIRICTSSFMTNKVSF